MNRKTRFNQMAGNERENWNQVVELSVEYCSFKPIRTKKYFYFLTSGTLKELQFQLWKLNRPSQLQVRSREIPLLKSIHLQIALFRILKNIA